MVSHLKILKSHHELQIQELVKQVEKLDTHQIVFLLEKIANYIRELKQTTNQYLWLEVAIIDLANLANNTSLLELQNRVQALEGGAVVPRASAPVQQVSSPSPVQQRPVVQEQKAVAPEPVSRPVQQAPSQVQAPQPAPSVQPTVVQPVDSSDLGAMWQALLKQVGSPSTQAMLRLANPVKIAKDEVIITFKQEIFVKQANEDGKKQVLEDAANKLFNQTNSRITIRLPQTGDAQLPKSQAVPSVTQAPSKPVVKPVVQPVEQKVPQSSKMVSETIQPELKSNALPSEVSEKKAEDYANVDQTKMIVDLFDGKFL
jgi:DNA polymerase III gamma/tau subunit